MGTKTAGFKSVNMNMSVNNFSLEDNISIKNIINLSFIICSSQFKNFYSF